MITFHMGSVELSIPVAQALLAFASTDKVRPQLGVGIDQGEICATDGHTAVRFFSSDPQPESSFEKTVWSAAYVKQAIAIAKASKTNVLLDVTGKSAGCAYPPQSEVETYMRNSDRIESDPIGINASLLTRLEAVCKACKADGATNPPAILESATGALNPVGFTVGRRGEPACSAHAALVTIMPERF